MDLESLTCLDTDSLATLAAGGSPPWAPGPREDDIAMERAATDPDRTRCMSEVAIFADLDEHEMDARDPWEGVDVDGVPPGRGSRRLA